MSAEMGKTKDSKSQNVRPTIGLLIGRLEERYQAHVWLGIVDVAQEQNVNLICFVGRSLRSPYEFDVQHTVVYDLVSAQRVDGLVIMSGTVGGYVDLEEFRTFCERYAPLPMVSVAWKLEGIPSIVADNYHGMRQVVTHLIEAHGYRRIAFIQGPEGHQEAAERFRAYTEALAEHGLPLDLDLVAPGDLVLATGAEAIHLLLDRRNKDFEAVIAANDEMALGALEALQARGIRVPHDVAVVGFDDNVEVAGSITPSLTTVQQPLYEEGRRAAETLLALLSGEEVPEQIMLPTALVVRRSCGCFSEAVRQTLSTKAVKTSQTLEEAFTRQREDILLQMKQAVGDGFIENLSERLERLLDAFYAELQEERAGVFLSTLDEALYQVAAKGHQVTAWQGVVSALRHALLPYLGGDEADILYRERAENLCQQARILIGEVAQQAQKYQQLQAERQADLLSATSQALIATFDMAGLMDMLVQELPELDVESCYLSLYEGDEIPSEWSRLMLAYEKQSRIELEQEEPRFRSCQLAPDGLFPQERRYTLAVQPLFFRENQLGFVLFEVKPQTRRVYETLRGQISSALKGALLLQEREQAEQALKTYATRLEQSNRELESFAYVASHDLQEPLRMVRSYLQLLERRYKDKLDQEANEFIAYAVDGATRMHTLINALLLYSRVGTQGKPFEPTDCAQVLQTVLTNLQVAIEESGVQVTYEALPTIRADAVQLAQLLQNLISNAIKFRRDRSAKVHIGVEQIDNEWVFSVRDNGIGIDPQQFDHIFMIFKRLHTREEYPGTGIGLAICKKIVERHGGRIWVESEPGQGATFYFTIPQERGS